MKFDKKNSGDQLTLSQSDWCLKINLKPTAFSPNVSLAFVYRGGKGSAGDDKPFSHPYKSINSHPNLNKAPEMEFIGTSLHFANSQISSMAK